LIIETPLPTPLPNDAIGRIEIEVFAATIQHRVLSIVRSILEKNAIDPDVHPESPLVDIGLMEMVELMLKVEAEFDLIIPQPQITPENFQSVKTLELMIANQLGPASTRNSGAAQRTRRSWSRASPGSRR
jgi:acyl carrier protein